MGVTPTAVLATSSATPLIASGAAETGANVQSGPTAPARDAVVATVTPLPPSPTPVASPWATTSPMQAPSPTPHPLAPYTLDALRQRPREGGVIRIRAVLDENEAYTRHYIEYPSDGLTITGVMHTPQGDGPFPVLILLHGYWSRDQYLPGTDTGEAADQFARRGYLVLAPDLRSWGESDTGLSLFHMGLVSDVVNLISALPSVVAADPERVGLWGHSMGGGIATKLLAVDDRVAAAVLYAPNSADDADLIARWGPGCLPGQAMEPGDPCNPADVILPHTPSSVVEGYLEAAADPGLLQPFAPIYHLDHVSAPVQIHVGTADGQGAADTPPDWSARLAEALRAAGKEVAYYSYDGQGHFFTGESWRQMIERAINWFESELPATGR